MKINIKTLTSLIAAFCVVAFCVVALQGGKDGSEAAMDINQDASNSWPGEVVLFSWADYIDPEVVAQFTQETGIEVRIETYDSPSQMKGYMRSKPGRYDIAVVDEFSMAELSEIQLIAPLNHAEIPNIKNMSEDFMGRDFDPTNRYSVPYTWGSVLIAYRNDKIEEPEESWSLLWDETLKGQIAIIEDEDDAFAVGLISSGFSIRSEKVDELNQVAKKMLDHAKNLRPKYLELEKIKEQLDSGALSAALCYSGDAMVMADENENISCFIPKEGAPLYIDSFTLVRDAPNRENAHKFIDFMSRGEIAGQNATYLWMATPNDAAIPHIDPETLEDTTVFLDKETFAKCGFYGMPTAKRDKITNQAMKFIMDEIHLNLVDEKSAE